MNKPQDARQYAPATQRNRQPILEVLTQVLPATGNVLEIASGTGEHAVYFAPRLSPRQWIPSDPNPLHRASITAWRKYLPCESLQPPLEIDVRESIWMVEEEALFNTSQITAIVNINMIHISPWAACLGLMAGAGRILPSGGILYLYGPFKRDGKHTAASNAAFDESLRAQNPEWGVRNLEDVVTAASTNNLSLLNIYQMPANNLSVVFNL
ncbi:SAM-dependent methyltransferase [Westiellopsis prolifica IICB1]|nr:SAM-dependent methyltransferase [Westiellopsis prolifica IICB1]